MRLSASRCHFWQCPLEQKGQDRGGGWVHLLSANSMAVSGLSCINDLVGTGRAIFVPFDINGVRNKRSRLVGPPLPAFKACFSVWYFSRDLTRRCLLIGECGQHQVSVKYD